MAETVLVRPELTPAMIAAGRALLVNLDTDGLVFDAAFWLLREDSIKWHLTLSSRDVRRGGSLSLYHEVAKTLHRLRLQDVLWIGDISIKDDHEQIVRSLRKALGLVGSVDGTRLDNATIGNLLIPACVLYRLSARQKLTSEAPPVGRRAARSPATV